jgi:hypothetical protein
MKLILMGDINLMDVTNPAEPESGRSRFALQETRHQNVVLGDSGPKSRFGRQFPHTRPALMREMPKNSRSLFVNWTRPRTWR